MGPRRVAARRTGRVAGRKSCERISSRRSVATLSEHPLPLGGTPRRRPVAHMAASPSMAPKRGGPASRGQAWRWSVTTGAIRSANRPSGSGERSRPGHEPGPGNPGGVRGTGLLRPPYRGSSRTMSGSNQPPANALRPNGAVACPIRQGRPGEAFEPARASRTACVGLLARGLRLHRLDGGFRRSL